MPLCRHHTIPRAGYHFGQGTGKICLEDVKCNGTELSLLDCHYQWNSNCSHTGDAGVSCMCFLYTCIIIIIMDNSTFDKFTFFMSRISYINFSLWFLCFDKRICSLTLRNIDYMLK